jgi:hypothetical protein
VCAARGVGWPGTGARVIPQQAVEPNGIADTDTDTDADTHTDTDAHTNTDGDPNADSHPDAHGRTVQPERNVHR